MSKQNSAMSTVDLNRHQNNQTIMNATTYSSGQRYDLAVDSETCRKVVRKSIDYSSRPHTHLLGNVRAGDGSMQLPIKSTKSGVR